MARDGTPVTVTNWDEAPSGGGGGAGAATSALQTTGNTTLSQLHTDLIAPTPAGAAIIGKVGIDQTTSGVSNNITLDGMQEGTPTAFVNGTTSGTNIVLASGPTAGMATGSVYAVSVASGMSNPVVQQSFGDGNWYNCNLYNAAANGTSSQVFAGVGASVFQIWGTQYRVITSGTVSSGSTVGAVTLKRAPYVQGVSVAGLVSLNSTNATIGNVLRATAYNESTTALGASATFNGASRDTGTAAGNAITQNVFSMFVRADQSGTANLQGSNDNAAWVTVLTGAIVANTPLTLTSRVFFRYQRVQVVNGATAQGSINVNSQYGE